MAMSTMIREIKEIHNKSIVMFKIGSFYHVYGKDAYILSYLHSSYYMYDMLYKNRRKISNYAYELE